MQITAPLVAVSLLRLLILAAFIQQAYFLISYFLSKPKLTQVSVIELPSLNITTTMCVEHFDAGTTDEDRVMYLMSKAYMDPTSCATTDYLNEAKAVLSAFDPDGYNDIVGVFEGDTTKSIEAWLMQQTGAGSQQELIEFLQQRLQDADTVYLEYRTDDSEAWRDVANRRASHISAGICGDATVDAGASSEMTMTMQFRHLEKASDNVAAPNNQLRFSILHGDYMETSQQALVKLNVIPSGYATDGTSMDAGSSIRTHSLSARFRYHKVERVSGCSSIEDAAPAANLAETLCSEQCVEEAYAHVHNCSFHSLRHPEWNPEQHRQCLCVTESEAVQERLQQCLHLKGCAKQAFCTGYYFDFSPFRETFEDGTPAHYVEGRPTTVTRLTLQFDSAPVIVEAENWAMDGFLLFAGVGGLLGIFLGGSIAGVVDMIVAAAQKLHGKKGAVAG